MNITRRRAFYDNAGEIMIPDGWIMGSRAWINQYRIPEYGGIKPPFKLEAVIDVGNGGSGMLIGSNYSGMYGVDGLAARYRTWGNGEFINVPDVFTANTPALVELDNISGDGSYKVDGTTVWSGDFASINAWYLFAGSPYAYAFRGYVHYIKIYKDDELVSHLVPCIDTDNVGQFYDVVRQEVIVAYNNLHPTVTPAT